MGLTRRSFVRALGFGGAATLAAPGWIAARGREALVGAGLDGDGWQAAGPGIRLSSNENPHGPSQAALQAMRDAFSAAPRYPGVLNASLVTAIARHHGVGEDHVLVGCGSGEILRMAVYASVGPGKPLVTAAPSFEDPVQHARTAGGEAIEIPVDARLRLDLEGMAARAPGAGLVFLCNPNNPTGTVYGASDVKTFITRVLDRSEATVVVDEAYHEYVQEPAYATAIPIALAHPRVLVARTFSKVHGLAGIRAGYAIGRPEALAPLRRHRLGNGVNVLASAAGVAALTQPAHVEQERARNREALEFTRRAFETLGFPSEPSHTNFVMVDIRRDVRGFISACREHQVQVGRLFPALPTHTRVSIGTMAEMRQAVEVFRKVLAAPA